jgi:hypothetical protein
MTKKRAKMTWHYYVMGFGTLMALMALSLSAWNAFAPAVGFVILALPSLQFKTITRLLFLVMFSILYYVGFPDSSVIQALMSAKTGTN